MALWVFGSAFDRVKAKGVDAMGKEIEIIMMPVSSIRPYENNPRKNDNAVDKVAASIQEFGFKVPMILDKNGVIVAGHTRLKAALKLGLKEVPVILADDLTDEQVKAFRLADNKTAELADWDFEALEKELAEISDIDMTSFGFDELLNDPADDEIEEVDVPDLPEEPTSKRGDIYALGAHRLICGDATILADVHRLMDEQLAALVVTDPPYNMNYVGAGGSRHKKKILNDHLPDQDFYRFIRAAYANYKNVMEDGASIYTFYKENGTGAFVTAMQEAGLEYKQTLIWVKNNIVLGGGSIPTAA